MLRKNLSALILSSSLIFNSCSSVNDLHKNSCGPLALEYTFDEYGLKVYIDEISQEIRSNSPFGNFLREFLMKISFNKDALEITWSSEIKDSLEKHLGPYNIKIERFCRTPSENKHYLKQLRSQDKKGIALVRKVKDHLSYHWARFNYERNPLEYYLDKTIISEIYVINEPIKEHQSSPQE